MSSDDIGEFEVLMTVIEAVANYGTSTYYTSAGDNLVKIVDTIYGSRDSIYYYVIPLLNTSYKDVSGKVIPLSWIPTESGLPAGIPIKYLSKLACSEVYEITG